MGFAPHLRVRQASATWAADIQLRPHLRGLDEAAAASACSASPDASSADLVEALPASTTDAEPKPLPRAPLEWLVFRLSVRRGCCRAGLFLRRGLTGQAPGKWGKEQATSTAETAQMHQIGSGYIGVGIERTVLMSSMLRSFAVKHSAYDASRQHLGDSNSLLVRRIDVSSTECPNAPNVNSAN